MNIKAYKAVGFAEQTAFSNGQYGKDYNNFKGKNKKRSPAYSRDLINYPNSNPIFIATDWQIANYIREMGGLCLVCLLEENYNLSCLPYREIWLFYLNRTAINEILILGRKIQAFASKVILILFDEKLLEVTSYA